MPFFGPPNVEKLEAKRDVHGLIKALGFQKGYAVRIEAAKALGKIGDARAVDPLIAVLKESDRDMRRTATEALGKIGAPAVMPLIAALKNDYFLVRRQAAKALGTIGDARAVDPLIAALKDREVCEEATEALGTIGDARAVDPLIATLKKGNSDIHSAAAKALDELGWQPSDIETKVCYLVAHQKFDKCVEIGAPAVEPLIAALKERESLVRYFMARTLSEIGVPAVEPLIAALKGSHSDVREGAAIALGKIGDARAVDPLIAALKDNEWSVVRKEAAGALGTIGDARAVEPLNTALKDSDSDVREEAAKALEKIGNVRI